jgi:DedD protein
MVLSTDFQLAESQDATQLQRRARRRLVGAIALVVFIVIVLPIVLDKEPSPVGQDLVIQIPGQDAGKFKTRVLPSSPSEAQPAVTGSIEKSASAKAEPPKSEPARAEAVKAEPAKALTDAPRPAVETKAAATPAPAPAKDAVAVQPPAKSDEKASADGAKAQSLLEARDAWVVPLGAFSSRDNVKQLQARLKAAGLTSYTEVLKGQKGEQTRVRAGPFDARAAAEKAREKLVEMGLKPGAVTTR